MIEQDIGALVYVGVVVVIWCASLTYAGWIQEEPGGYTKEKYVWMMLK